MQPQSRLGDQSYVPADNHFRVRCPHQCIGPAETGSLNVLVNNLPALRILDMGIHAQCCGSNTWIAVEGSKTVFINNLPAHRLGDLDMHCGGPGYMVQGSPNVWTGG
jgi:uncharacterized Zn-binding protein involved in type VI secretion